jgi:hypothetical protein
MCSWFTDAASVRAIVSYTLTAVIMWAIWLLARRITKLSERRNGLVTQREKLKEAKRDRSSALWGEDEHFAGLRQYREDVRGVIDDYRLGANHYRRIHNIFQSIVIAGSIVTTSVTSAAGQVPAFRWAAPAISLVVGVSAGMTGYFKFKERSLNLQQTADQIEHQCNCVDLRISSYRKFVDKPREAFVEFAEVVEHLKDEQRKREQQLEQPPEIGQRTA